MKFKFVLFGAMSLLSGCAAVPNVVAPPSISVQDVSLQNLSLTQGTALVGLQVTNPNAFPIPLEGIQYNLRLNGTPVASGDQRQSTYLQPNNRRQCKFPCNCNSPLSCNSRRYCGRVVQSSTNWMEPCACRLLVFHFKDRVGLG